MRLLALVLCAALVAPSACAEKKVRYDNYAVYRVFIDNAIQLTIANQLSQTQEGYNVWRSVVGVGSDFEIMVSPAVVGSFNALTKLYGFRTKLLIPNVQKLIDNESKPKSADATFGFDDYHTLEEIYSWMDELKAKFPRVVSTFSLGKTYEGRDIRGIKIKQSLLSHSAVFIEANANAREWITGATATYIINEILNSENWYFRWLAELVDWYIVPIHNPDGYVYSRNYERFWSKNRSRRPGTDCIGVNLSYNYNVQWRETLEHNPACSDAYSGPEPLSEQETKGLDSYIKRIVFKEKLFISLGAYRQYVLTPSAYTSDRPENYDDLLEIANAAAGGIYDQSGSVYRTGPAIQYTGYARGSVVDWAQEEIPGRVAVLRWVLRDEGEYGLLLPGRFIVPTGEETVRGLADALLRAKILHYI